MRIGIDIDDTITNTTSKMFEYMQKLNIEKTGDFCNYTNEEFERYRSLMVEYIEPVLSSCTLKDECVEVIRKLKDMGHKIYIITARSNRFSKNIYDITLNYLKENNILFDKFFFDYENKKDICIEQKIDYMIDDNINVYNSLVGTSTKPLLFTKEANMKYSCERVNDWNEVLELFK